LFLRKYLLLSCFWASFFHLWMIITRIAARNITPPPELNPMVTPASNWHLFYRVSNPLLKKRDPDKLANRNDLNYLKVSYLR
jgi:hypothetical protein